MDFKTEAEKMLDAVHHGQAPEVYLDALYQLHLEGVREAYTESIHDALEDFDDISFGANVLLDKVARRIEKRRDKLEQRQSLEEKK